MQSMWASWVVFVLAGTLAGCGGGGGGGSSGGGGGGSSGGPSGGSPGGAVGEAPRVGLPDFAAEGTRNWGLADVGGDVSQAAGKTGAGVLVGIVDTGIDVNHPDFAGAIDPASINIVTGKTTDVADQGGHGTSVAGVIAARKDGFDGLGVAPGASLLMVRSDVPGTCTPSSSNCLFSDSDLATATNYAVAHGAKIINYSLGGSSIDPVFQNSLINAASQGRILVAAAGNSAGASPIDPALSLTGAGMQGLGLAVGAVDQNNQLTWFSNKAGAAKDFYLVAPGINVTTTANGGGTHSVSGTSFAAPHVAGAAAVVWGASPFLTGQQVVSILLNSATDLGTAGVDDTYGHGLLNLSAALQPLGPLVVPTGANVADGGRPLASSQLALGAPFGTALAGKPALAQAIFVDSYGRPFHTDLSAAVKAPAAGGDISGWLGEARMPVSTTSLGKSATLTLAAPPEASPGEIFDRPGGSQGQPRFSLSADLGGSQVAVARGFGLGGVTGLAAAAPEVATPFLSGNPLTSPFLGLAGGGTSAAFGHSVGDGWSVKLGFSRDEGTPQDGLTLPTPTRSAMLAETAKRWQDGSVVGAQLGRLDEGGGPLGSSGTGAFAFDSKAATAFTTLYAATPLSRSSSLFATWSYGLTDGIAGQGLLGQFSSIHSQSFSVGAATTDIGIADDRLAFIVYQPLRVTSGQATLSVPVGRLMDGTVVYHRDRVGLAAEGVETDLQVTYTVPLAQAQRLTLGGMVMMQPGNDSTAGLGLAGGLKYRLSW
jgi:subtilisin family serine protease